MTSQSLSAFDQQFDREKWYAAEAHVTERNFRMRTLEEIHQLSHSLSLHFPKPEQFVTGIYELLLNAVEHGNLGLGFEAKTQLICEGKWKEEITRRLMLEKYAEKEVHITLAHNTRESRLTIADQGAGFPWREYVGRQANGRTPNGRGLLIAFSSKFDRIMFNAAGNEVTCIVKFCNWPAGRVPAGAK